MRNLNELLKTVCKTVHIHFRITFLPLWDIVPSVATLYILTNMELIGKETYLFYPYCLV